MLAYLVSLVIGLKLAASGVHQTLPTSEIEQTTSGTYGNILQSRYKDPQFVHGWISCRGLAYTPKPWFHNEKGHDWFIRLPVDIQCEKFIKLFTDGHDSWCKDIRGYHCWKRHGNTNRPHQVKTWNETRIWFNTGPPCMDYVVRGKINGATNGKIGAHCRWNGKNDLKGLWNGIYPEEGWDYHEDSDIELPIKPSKV
jgi:hypothetical protein